MALMNGLEEELTCPIHLDFYEEPMQLSCLHILCKSDVDRLAEINGYLECPQCKYISIKPDIKRDFRTQRLLDLRKASEEKLRKQQKCDGCEDDIASIWCYDCGVHLCGRCERTHLKLAISATHTLENIQNVAAIKEERKTVIQEMLDSIQEITPKLDIRYDKVGIDIKLRDGIQKMRETSNKILMDVKDTYTSLCDELHSVAKQERERINAAITTQKECNKNIQTLQDILKQNDTKSLLNEKSINQIQAESLKACDTMRSIRNKRNSYKGRWENALAKNYRVLEDLHQAVQHKKQEVENRKRASSLPEGNADFGPMRKLSRPSTSSQSTPPVFSASEASANSLPQTSTFSNEDTITFSQTRPPIVWKFEQAATFSRPDTSTSPTYGMIQF